MPAFHYKWRYQTKPHSFTYSKIPRTWPFHVVVLQRKAKKYTKNNNTRAKLLFCSLNLLFSGVIVGVAVVVCLRSLQYWYSKTIKRRPYWSWVDLCHYENTFCFNTFARILARWVKIFSFRESTSGILGTYLLPSIYLWTFTKSRENESHNYKIRSWTCTKLAGNQS